MAPASPGATFVDIGAALVGVVGSIDWGDYDNDGDLDIAIAGVTSSAYVARIYRNDGKGAFSDIGAPLLSGYGAALAWGDLDRDGDLDLALATRMGSKLYRNNGNDSFEDTGFSLPQSARGSVAWGDCENDGDLDLLLAGADSDGITGAVVYRNEGAAGFLATTPVVSGLEVWYAEWGDDDDDGDLDVCLTGWTGSASVTRLFRNEGRCEFEAAGDLPAEAVGGVSTWVDFDNDGDLDLLANATGVSGTSATMFRNDGHGGFVGSGVALAGISAGGAAWGDADNDGDADLALVGRSGSSNIIEVFRNDGGSFVDLDAGLAGLSSGKVAWGDSDADGDLDLLLAGYGAGGYVTKLYRNDGTFPNGVPEAPADLSAPKLAGRADLGWLAASDPETPADGLTYSIRVGTTPGGVDIVSPMASTVDGSRRLAAMGNAQHGTSAFVKPLPPGSYYWSVQAVDTAFAGSPFAVEGVVEVCSVGIDPSFRTFPHDGGTLTVTVSAEPDCTWTVGAAPDWIQVLSGMTGAGPGTVTISVSPNAGPARSYAIDIGGQALTVSQEQIFTEIGADLLGVWSGMGSWGDYDNDGDLDVFLFGCHDCWTGGSYEHYSKLYRNDGGGVFTDSGASLVGVTRGATAWGDLDADGDLDLVLVGDNSSWPHPGFAAVYRNDGGGAFVDTGADLIDVVNASASLGDHDNDGDLDLLITGRDGSIPGSVTRLYRNDGGLTFSEVSVEIIGVSDGSTDWGDFDNDGDLDLALIGQATERVSKVYRNDGGGAFSDLGTDLVGVSSGSVAWGDYDSDGDLDLLVAGYTYIAAIGGLSVTKVYRNEGGGTFTEANAELVGVHNGSAEWCDLDNDGNLDALVTGYSYSAAVGGGEVLTRVHLGDGAGGFVETDPGIAGISEGNATCGDYDNDGDLDVLTVGRTTPGLGPTSRIYRNNGTTAPNVAPTTPAGLDAVGGAGHVVLQWDPSSDPATPSPGLTYNLRVGTTPGGYDVAAPMASLADGWRRLPKRGSIGPGTTALLTSLEPGTYYWSVQAIDTGFAGSLFAGEGTFSTCEATIDPPAATIGAAGGNGTVGVSSSAECAWLAISQVPWVSIVAGTSGSGEGTVEYSVAVNPGPARTGTILVAGRIHTVTQESGCTYTLDPPDAQFPQRGGDGSFAVTTHPTCEWSASTAVRWMSVTGGTSGKGNGIVQYLVDPNWGSSRIGTITVGVAAHTVEQDRALFKDTETPLISGSIGSVAWGDYDSDGDLDLLLTGGTASGYVTKLYRNAGGTLSDTFIALPGVSEGAADWGDYDNDGDLDLVLGGLSMSGWVTVICRNDGLGAFTDIGAGLVGIEYGSAKWGDYDNDGDLDVLISGYRYDTATTSLYRNQGAGLFVEVQAGLPPLVYSSTAWGDLDNDGDLDLLLSGWGASGAVAEVRRNDGGGTFVNVPAGLAGSYWGSVSWGDFDNDGDLDILQTGQGSGDAISRIYRNDVGGVFTDVAAGLVGVQGSSAWGDYDNDGDLDVALTGYSYQLGRRVTRLYRNDQGGRFTDVGHDFPGDPYRLAWADYDNDGDLDLLVAGQTTALYRNDFGVTNTVPAAPSALWADASAGQMSLSWLPSIDAETPGPGLTYNLRVSTTPGGVNILSPMASVDTGSRRVSQMGNANHGTSAVLTLLAPGTYYWSVQAIDTAFAGSPFSAEGTVSVCGASIDPSAQSVPSGGGAALVSVTAAAECSWSVASHVGWIGVTAGATGAGNGSVELSVAANVGPARSGTLTIAGREATIHQASGCTYSMDPVTATAPVRGGTGTVQVTTTSGCAWTAVSNDAWLTVVSGTGGSGNGVVEYAAGVNTAASPRIGTITIAGLTFTLSQAGGRFEDVGGVFADISAGQVAWGDYDADGDLDLVVAGLAGGALPVTRVYRNDGDTVFTDVGAELVGLGNSSVAWGDYDNDGDLDLLVAGNAASAYQLLSHVYRNDGSGMFTEIGAGLVGAASSSVAWGDFDNDGRLDILLTGGNDDGYVAKVYRNTGLGAFADLGVSLPGMHSGGAAWGDYDNDDDLDILIGGVADPSSHISPVHRNDGGGVFTDIQAGFGSGYWGATAWADFDNDGDLDALVPLHLYSNQGGAFSAVGPMFENTCCTGAPWGDLENDGDLDLFLGGTVLRNDGGGSFADAQANVVGSSYSLGEWGDFDNDGDLDLVLDGRLYRNENGTANTVPTAPSGLSAEPGLGDVLLSWAPSWDAQTPSAGLTYNLRVSTTPGGVGILSPMASVATGWRHVPAMGNANLGTTALLSSLEPGTYFWSVQAVDTAFAGSPFAPEATFTIAAPVGTDTPGIYRSSDRSWYLKNSNTPGAADLVFPYGDPADQAVKGDWDGDGDDTVGIYRDGVFFLKNTNGPGNADLVIGFGAPGDIPVAGDWDGDGIDTIGVYRPSEAAWFLRNSNTAGAPDLSFTFGLANETPVVGDWDGNGTDTVGIFRASDRQWYLHNSNAGGNAELVFPYGDPAQDVPVVGDWDGDGDDTVGIYRAALGEWFLKNTNEAGFADLNFVYGLVNEKPLAGDWDGD
ncbi:MAG: VCBS repeat-containing protein [Acidobacteria bacterium]|nr:VCBS repeat-containing protein [Acidobacteriota bacterium]